MKDMEHYLIDLLGDKGICTDTCSEYGEPGYSLDKNEGLILFGDWNMLNKYPNIMEYLEANYAIEWSDEWVVDYENDKAYRCSPDSYAWRPSCLMHKTGEIIGVDCLNDMDDEDFRETCKQNGLLNNADTAINIEGFNPRGEDFTGSVLGHEYSANAGLYERPDDSPADMLEKALEEDSDGFYYFVITDKGQFDVDFKIYKL